MNGTATEIPLCSCEEKSKQKIQLDGDGGGGDYVPLLGADEVTA